MSSLSCCDDDDVDNGLQEQRQQSQLDQQRKEEEEEAVQPANAAAAASLSSIPNAMEDPLRMDLTIEECELAMGIRRAILADPEIHQETTVSDFMCCQLAIKAGELDIHHAVTTNQAIDDALDRVKHLQMFREECGVIDDSVAVGCRALQKLVLDLVPGYFMEYAFHEDSYSMFVNFKCFDSRKCLNTPQKMNDWIVGYYYLYHAFCPDFETIRQGMTSHIECNGYDWARGGFNTKTTQLLLDTFGNAYPSRLKTYFYHTGVMFNTMSALSKKFMPKKDWDTFKVGCEAPAYLDEIYNQPTVDVASTKTLANLQKCLKRRYQMEKEFSLDTFCKETLELSKDAEGNFVFDYDD